MITVAPTSTQYCKQTSQSTPSQKYHTTQSTPWLLHVLPQEIGFGRENACCNRNQIRCGVNHRLESNCAGHPARTLYSVEVDWNTGWQGRRWKLWEKEWRWPWRSDMHSSVEHNSLTSSNAVWRLIGNSPLHKLPLSNGNMPWIRAESAALDVAPMDSNGDLDKHKAKPVSRRRQQYDFESCLLLVLFVSSSVWY